MNDIIRLVIADAKLQKLIAEKKLEACKNSTHMVKKFHAELIAVEIEVLNMHISMLTDEN